MIFALVVLNASSPAYAQTKSASPTPAASPVAQQSYCPLSVRYAQKLGASDSTLVAFVLGTDSDAGAASGVLSFYENGVERYDVPFEKLPVVGLHDTVEQATSIVIRFPKRRLPYAGFVSRLDSPEPFLCPLGMVWYPSGWGRTSLDQPVDQAAFAAHAAGATEVSAGRVIRQADPSCDSPDVPVRVVKEGALTYPAMSSATRTSGTADILVLLRPDGAVGGIDVIKSSGDPFLDSAASHAAADTKYSPERFRCQAVFGEYVYHTEFTFK